MKTNLILAVFAFLLVGVSTGCDPKRGCTDNLADNFDPEAKQDDDTCVPTREKFVGEYEANGTILVGPDTLVPYDQVYVNVVDSTANLATELIIGISNFDQPLYPLTATVVGKYDLGINRQTIGVFTYYGVGNVNGRVLELGMTRLEKITLPDETFFYDTLILNLYGIEELEP
jgi:hypothetical protein